MAARPWNGGMHAAEPIDSVCRQFSETVDLALSPARTHWDLASELATRLTAVLPAQRASDLDTAYVLQELGKALAEFPPLIASDVSALLMRTSRFRPVPAEIIEAGQKRMAELRGAKRIADLILSDRVDERERQANRRREDEEEQRCLAAGEETPRQRRARVADECARAIRGIAARQSAGEGAPADTRGRTEAEEAWVQPQRAPAPRDQYEAMSARGGT